jgi:aminoglycoside 2'-N-acetyltransferase I
LYGVGPMSGSDRDARIQVAATSALDGHALSAARALLYDVFDDMTEQDWRHTLGGTHALLWQSGELVGHGSVIPRTLLLDGRALHAGYVEGVAVRRERRRRGHGGALMAALEEVIRGSYDLGALGASEEGMLFYGARDWTRWEGSTWALSTSGRLRTAAEDDCIFVLPGAVALDLSGELTCDRREGDPWGSGPHFGHRRTGSRGGWKCFPVGR